MKKFVLLLTSVFFVGMVASCGGNNTKPATQPTADQPQAAAIKINVIRTSEDPAPKWINKRWEIGKDEMGRKVIYLVVEGQKPTLEKAEADAVGKKLSQMADAIKQLTTHEFAIAKQGMLNDETELDTYFEETIAAVSRNVNTSGALNVADYWEYIQEIQGSESKTYYRILKRYAIDYDQFQKSLKGAWEPTAKKVPPELKNKADKVIDSIYEGYEE